MENNGNNGINFEELHKEGLERKYYKQKAKNGIAIARPFSHVATHLYQLASVARTELLMSFLLMIPFIALSIIFFVNDIEKMSENVFAYIAIGVEVLALIYFCSVKMRKMEVERSLSVVNQYFDKAYTHRKVSIAASVVSGVSNYHHNLRGSSFSGAVGAVSAGVSIYCDFKAIQETIDGIKTQTKEVNKDFAIRANKIKDAHGYKTMASILILALTIIALYIVPYGYYKVTKNADGLSTVFGFCALLMCLDFVPNIIFQTIYIKFLVDAGELLFDAEKISAEDMEKFESELKNKEKDKK